MVCVQVVRMIRLTEGLFDKSRMKRPDIFEDMKSWNFVLAPNTPAYVRHKLHERCT